MKVIAKISVDVSSWEQATRIKLDFINLVDTWNKFNRLYDSEFTLETSTKGKLKEVGVGT